MKSCGRAGLLLVLLGFACLVAADTFAQSPMEVRARDGRDFLADRVEDRGEIVILYGHGFTAPIQLRRADIMCVVPVGTPCLAAQQTPTRAPAPPLGDVSRFGVHGSNTIGSSLMPALIGRFAEQMLAMQNAMGSIHVQPGAPNEQTIELHDGKGDLRAVIDFKSHGSGTAFKDLEAKTIVIAMSSRSITPEEVTKLNAAYQTNMLAPANEHILALDGLAVIVNRANPINALSIDEIGRIFAGEMTNWSQLGGPNATPKLHARDDVSGTFDTFKELVLKGKPISTAAKRYESSDDLSAQVSEDPNAIGFIGLPYVGKNKALQVRQDCGLVFKATKFNIQTETYPLSRRLFLYTLGTPTDPMANILLQFALSDAAQPTVTDTGFVDQAIALQDAGEQADWLNEVQQTTGGDLIAAGKRELDWLLSNGRSLRRSSLQLRFAFASASLDNKALADVQRLARYLKRPENSSKRWVLVGFADGVGSYEQNRSLSLARARAVADGLRREGIAATDRELYAASKMAPVDCNDSEAGRRQNRRVEVWLENYSVTTNARKGISATDREFIIREVVKQIRGRQTTLPMSR